MVTGVLERLPDAVVVIDRAGTIQAVNQRAGLLLGIDHQAVGSPAAGALSLRDADGTPCVLPPARPRVGDRMPERLLRVCRDGREPRAVVCSGRWDDDGFVLVVRSAARLAGLERAQGDVVATVSHEIRSPLASIKGFTRTLLGRWDRFTDEQKLAMLATVDADADRVTRLLLDLLAVARIDAGRIRLRRAAVALDELVDEVIARLATVHEPKVLADRPVLVEADEATPPVLGDRDRIEQVVTNLLDNALKHARTGPVVVRVAPDGQGARLSVSDQGPGVPEHRRDSVFRKFGRGREDQRGGTGLGLYISRGLVHAHGGSIWLDPDVQDGATFHVWLPAGDEGPGARI